MPTDDSKLVFFFLCFTIFLKYMCVKEFLNYSYSIYSKVCMLLYDLWIWQRLGKGRLMEISYYCSPSNSRYDRPLILCFIATFFFFFCRAHCVKGQTLKRDLTEIGPQSSHRSKNKCCSPSNSGYDRPLILCF